MRKEIDGRHRRQRESAALEQPDVTRKGGRVARHEDHSLRRASQDGRRAIALKARSARIGDHDVDVRTTPPADICSHDAGGGVFQIDACVADRRASALNGNNCAGTVDDGREQTDTTVEVGHPAVGPDSVADEVRERVGTIGAHLEE